MQKSANQKTDNNNKQGVDQAPGEEQNKGEQVTQEDLKGKKVDGDPEDDKDQPITTNKKDKGKQ